LLANVQLAEALLLVAKANHCEIDRIIGRGQRKALAASRLRKSSGRPASSEPASSSA
jgi:hypothetical protein